MKGHWAREHDNDGTLKPGAVLIESNAAANKSINSRPPHLCRRTITLTLVSLGDCHQECDFPDDFFGPLVDDGAPYSGIELHKFGLLKLFLVPEWNGILYPLPASIVDTPYWQYSSGQHACKPRRILGSVLVFVLWDQGTTVQIRHLFISGASKCVIGRNATCSCDIQQIEANKRLIPHAHGSPAHCCSQWLIVTSTAIYHTQCSFLSPSRLRLPVSLRLCSVQRLS